MTSLRVRDSLDSNQGKIKSLISLLTRTALESEDSFDDIPEDVHFVFFIKTKIFLRFRMPSISDEEGGDKRKYFQVAISGDSMEDQI
jgi:hypothetical protein